MKERRLKNWMRDVAEDEGKVEVREKYFSRGAYIALLYFTCFALLEDTPCSWASKPTNLVFLSSPI